MSGAIIIAVSSAVVVALLGWFATEARAMRDRRKIYGWLSSNTRDEHGESHVDTVTLAKGSCLPEDRVRRACMSDKRIYHYARGSDEQWSIWRKEPQGIYEKRGPIVIEDVYL